MKRTPLPPRKKPLKRGGPIKAKGKSRFPKRRCPEYIAWIREQQCALTDLWRLADGLGKVHWCHPRPERLGTEPAHIKTQGAGGSDLWNTVPLCPAAHDEQEGHTTEFEARYGVDLTALAADYTRRYLDETRQIE